MKDKHKTVTTRRRGWLGTLLLTVLLIALASCGSDKPDNIEPVLHTLEATDITRTSATLHGTVTLQGETAMPVAAFRYGNDNSMTVAVNATATDDGNVTANIDGLTAGTTYQFQLQATNGAVTLHGETMTFATIPNDKPTVGAATVLSHGPMSAIIGFDVPNDGGETLTASGCYMVEGEVTSLVDKTKATTLVAEKVASAEWPWRVVATGLTANTTYTFFPYAVSRVGESVGTGVTLTTGNATQLHEAGEFSKMMSNGAGGNLEGGSLTISGPMNGDDLACLRSLGLASIDMTDVHIVSGGKAYSESYYSEDNVVGPQIFAGCTTLTSILLPNDAVKISKDAFRGCTGLKEITIPATATDVTPSTGCTALQSINVSGANTTYKSVDGVLTNAAVTEIVWFPMGKTGSYTLPETITAVGDYAFSECSITEFTLPDNLTTLGQSVFYDSKVEKVTLPDKLRTVPAGTFQKCRRLRTVSLGSATEQISDYVFDGCPLTDLFVNADLPPVCNAKAFATSGNDFTKTCVVHVPKGRANYYRTSKAWKVFTHIREE